MAEYKLYVLGPSGMIARGIWLDCEDDEGALAQARTRERDAARELWSGLRLVRSFAPAQRRAD